MWDWTSCCVLSEMVGPEGEVVAVDPGAERIKIAVEMNARPNIEYMYLVGNDQAFPGVGYNSSMDQTQGATV